LKSPKAAILFVASAACVGAAAEELNFDRTQWMVGEIASQSLTINAGGIAAGLASATPRRRIEMHSSGHVGYTTSVEATDDFILKATVKAEAPTLFLRYLGVDTRPVQIVIEMSPTDRHSEV
jgi:hypothetical protein